MLESPCWWRSMGTGAATHIGYTNLGARNWDLPCSAFANASAFDYCVVTSSPGDSPQIRVGGTKVPNEGSWSHIAAQLPLVVSPVTGTICFTTSRSRPRVPPYDGRPIAIEPTAQPHPTRCFSSLPSWIRHAMPRAQASSSNVGVHVHI